MSNSAKNLINALATLIETIEAFQAEITAFEAQAQPARNGNGQAHRFGHGIEVEAPRRSASPATGGPGTGRPRFPGSSVPFGPDNPTRTGHELYAWASRSDEQTGTNLIGNLVAWGKRNQCPGRITGWSEDDVAAAFAAVCPKPSN